MEGWVRWGEEEVGDERQTPSKLSGRGRMEGISAVVHEVEQCSMSIHMEAHHAHPFTSCVG